MRANGEKRCDGNVAICTGRQCTLCVQVAVSDADGSVGAA